MSVSGSSLGAVTSRFDNAASSYDEVASIQAEVAQHLVDWAMPAVSPADTLDVGSGTGFVAQAVARRWPRATIAALDCAPSMLLQAKQKMPELKTIAGDAAAIDLDERFDTIFSSMLLHWLPDPLEALRRWQGWLKPDGRLYVALLIEGSFQEWRDVCARAGLKDGLWPMPHRHFADSVAVRAEQGTLSVAYPSATEFLRHLKSTGASTPREEHAPFSASMMRNLLSRAPRPFPVSYETLYIELPSSPKS